MAERSSDRIGRSIRALLDLPRYLVVGVERWAGWGRLTLEPKAPRFRCPQCRVTVAWGKASRWRPLRDLDVGRRHIELLVRVYRIRCPTCGEPEVAITLARQYARCTRRLEKPHSQDVFLPSSPIQPLIVPLFRYVTGKRRTHSGLNRANLAAPTSSRRRQAERRLMETVAASGRHGMAINACVALFAAAPRRLVEALTASGVRVVGTTDAATASSALQASLSIAMAPTLPTSSTGAWVASSAPGVARVVHGVPPPRRLRRLVEALPA